MKGAHYTADEVLSYNAKITTIMSIRSLGKSYDMMKRLLNVSLSGKNVAWSRWDADQTKTSLAEFKAFAENTKNVTLSSETVAKGITWLTPKDMENVGSILFVPVKDAAKAKGIDRVFKWWVYDEFIPEFYTNRTQKETEYEKWQSLYTTLRRNNSDFRAVLMGNRISWFNDYFTHWGVRPFPSGEIRRFKRSVFGYESDIVVEHVKPSPEALERIIKFEVEKGRTEEEILDYLENATQDKDFFIGKCPDLNTPLEWIQLYSRGSYYGWREYDGHIYFTPIKPRLDRPIMALNRRELSDGMIRDRGIGQKIEDWINRGIVRFDSGKTLNAIFDLVALSRERL